MFSWSIGICRLTLDKSTIPPLSAVRLEIVALLPIFVKMINKNLCYS